ncbi:MAG: hypothetical protein AAF937_07040 [Planctomycetota bacterium]
MSTESNTRSGRWPLIAINAGLAAVIGITALAPAQPDANRARGDYAIVGGEFLGGGGENAVYIVDATNQDLIAVRWDRTRQALQGIGYRDLSVDAQERPGR